MSDAQVFLVKPHKKRMAAGSSLLRELLLGPLAVSGRFASRYEPFDWSELRMDVGSDPTSTWFFSAEIDSVDYSTPTSLIIWFWLDSTNSVFLNFSKPKSIL